MENRSRSVIMAWACTLLLTSKLRCRNSCFTLHGLDLSIQEGEKVQEKPMTPFES